MGEFASILIILFSAFIYLLRPKQSVSMIPNMNSPTIKQTLQEFINNHENVTIEEIIEYLDYINKTRYSTMEVSKLLEEIISEKGRSS